MDCPSCERILSTEAGLRQHHTKVHDRSLPNRTCRECGAAFYDPKSRREYCDDCDPNAGQSNGNWSGALETTTCAECGSDFEYYPSEKDGVYCPACIEGCDGLLPENPMEPTERVAAECPACGTEQLVLQSLLERRERGVFCDLDCYGDWLSENVVGSDHYQWTDSDPVYEHGCQLFVGRPEYATSIVVSSVEPRNRRSAEIRTFITSNLSALSTIQRRHTTSTT